MPFKANISYLGIPNVLWWLIFFRRAGLSTIVWCQISKVSVDKIMSYCWGFPPLYISNGILLGAQVRSRATYNRFLWSIHKKGCLCRCNETREDRTRVALSRVQRLIHWAIMVPERRLAGSLHYSPLFGKSEPPGSGHFQPRRGASTQRRNRVTTATSVTGRAGIEPRIARSRIQRLNHWAIMVPERPSRLRLAGSLHRYPLHTHQ